jgi:signal transduction histidine kinase
VDVQIEGDEDQLTVSVKDTGIGIDDADQGRIFDRFYRGNDGRVTHITGSGLGLAMAREAVRLHGGDIEVESRRDCGSTFILTFPVRSDAA